MTHSSDKQSAADDQLSVFERLHRQLREERLRKQLRDWQIQRAILGKMTEGRTLNAKSEARDLARRFDCPDRLSEIEAVLLRTAAFNDVPVNKGRARKTH